MTLDHLSSLIGDDERTDRSTTVGDDGRWSSTESASVRRLAPSALLRTLRAGEAVVCLEQAVRLKPDNALAHLNLGVMQARLGLFDEALRQFDETLRLEPDNQQAREYIDLVQNRQNHRR